jgi:hypothetical protein
LAVSTDTTMLLAHFRQTGTRPLALSSSKGNAER